MKRPDIFDLLADVPRKVIDENAFTVMEIAKALSVSRDTASKIAKKKVESGEWEQVWKGHPRPAPAYRKVSPAKKHQRR